MGKRGNKRVFSTRVASIQASSVASPLPESSVRVDDSLANATPPPGDLIEKDSAEGEVKPGFVSVGCQKLCRHAEKDVNVVRFSSQLGKIRSPVIQCQDCVKGAKSGMGKKNKGKSAKKKLTTSACPPNASYALKRWICLSCGHIGCGTIFRVLNSHSEHDWQNETDNARHEGIGKGHAWKHWLYSKHSLAMLCDDRLICWCFICMAAVDYELTEAAGPNTEGRNVREISGSDSEPVNEAANLLRQKLIKVSANLMDPPKACVVSLNKQVVDATTSEKSNIEVPYGCQNNLLREGFPQHSQRKRLVKGLVNLGNTCFFNSVMQNLLALNVLRDYFSQESHPVEGPLTSSLRRLYLDSNVYESGTNLINFGHVGLDSGLKKGTKGRASCESSTRGVYNPRLLFSAICAKAPRFRGFQQQDSHELLRCMLDGLHTEEQRTRMAQGESVEVDDLGKPIPPDERHVNGNSKVDSQTKCEEMAPFVEEYFGGQLSSTVCCCVCGFSSVVYEPFLDLSLQVPSKQSWEMHHRGSGQATTFRSVGKGYKDSLEGDVKSARFPEKTEFYVNLQSTSHTMTEKEEHKSVLPSASPIQVEPSLPFPLERNNVVKDGVTGYDDMNDFGWLDYLGGGTQSAEGSLQVPCNNIVNVQQAGKSNGFQLENSSSSPENGSTNCLLVGLRQERGELGCVTSGNCEAFDDDIVRQESLALNGYSKWDSGSSLQKDPIVDMPGFRQDVATDVGTEKQVITDAQFGQEDEAPVLASDLEVLLLPYVKLPLPNENSMHSNIVNSHSDTSTCLAEDWNSKSCVTVEEDEGNLDGFAQLFEEEEESTCFENRKEKGIELIDNLQVVPEYSMDALWEVGSGSISGCQIDICSSSGSKELDTLDDNLPLSLDGCLLDFTKSELLCGENAWGCFNCFERQAGKLNLLTAGNASNSPDPDSTTQSQDELAQGRNQIDFREISRSHGSKCIPNGKIVHSVMDETVCRLPNQLRDSPEASCVSYFEETDVGVSSQRVCAAPGGCHSFNCNGNFESLLESENCKHAGVGSRLSTGNARLNELDSGQHSGGQSFSRKMQSVSELDCNERLGCDFVNKFGHLQEKGSIYAVQERNMGYEYHQSQVGGFAEGKKVEGILCAYSSGMKEGQGMRDFSSASSLSMDEAELSGSCHIPGKMPNLQRPTNKRKEQESKKTVKRNATKRLLISKAPPILTIHLKRFAQDTRGRLSKLGGHVAFKEWLDLRPFLDPKCPNSKSCTYRLVGIVEHTGTMKGGHYIAYVRGPSTADEGSQELEKGCLGDENDWYCISDSHVQKSTLQTVLNSEAYLLFYEKCKITVSA